MRAYKNISFDTPEHLLLVYVDEDNASSTASAWGIKRTFAYVR